MAGHGTNCGDRAVEPRWGRLVARGEDRQLVLRHFRVQDSRGEGACGGIATRLLGLRMPEMVSKLQTIRVELAGALPSAIVLEAMRKGLVNAIGLLALVTHTCLLCDACVCVRVFGFKAPTKAAWTLSDGVAALFKGLA